MFIAGIDAVEAFFLFGLLFYACVLIIVFVPLIAWAWATGKLEDYS